jgi:ankyrin repeat protein
MLMTKAVQEGRLDIVEYLLDTGMEPDKEKALLHEAVKNDDLPMVQAIGPFYDVSSRDLNGDAPLHIARSQDVAQWLIHHGARADAQNKHGKFPYETMHDENLAAWLEQEYLALHPRVEEEILPAAPV